MIGPHFDVDALHTLAQEKRFSLREDVNGVERDSVRSV